MRFISIELSFVIGLLCARGASAEENLSTEIPVLQASGEEKHGTDQAAPVREPEKVKMPEKDLDSSINLKTGIDYGSEKDYSMAKRERASEYFTRGTLLYDTGDYASAAEAFKLAYETLPHQAVLGNIALCYDRAGKLPQAVRYYRKYFLDPVSHKANEQMRQRLDELNNLVGEMDIECKVKDCHLRVDGIDQGRAPVEVILLPGEHRIVAMAAGEVVDETIMKINARDIVTVEIDASSQKKQRVQRMPQTPPVVFQLPPREQKSGLRSGFWVATGITASAGVGVIVFGSLTLSTRSEYEASDRLDVDLRDQGRSYRLATNILAGVAGTAAVIAVVLGVTDLTRSKKRKREHPTLSPSPLGVTLHGTF